MVHIYRTGTSVQYESRHGSTCTATVQAHRVNEAGWGELVLRIDSVQPRSVASSDVPPIIAAALAHTLGAENLAPKIGQVVNLLVSNFTVRGVTSLPSTITDEVEPVPVVASDDEPF
jgi:hypothetical protein